MDMKRPQPFWKNWDLRKNPFGNIETADDVFESSEMEKITEVIAEAVEEGGIYSIVGERGIGKTTAKNETINYFNENPERFAYSVLECMDLKSVKISAILTALILDLSPSYVKPKQHAEYRARQAREIMGKISAHKKVVLIIDEAQKLNITTMEELKKLTEMTWGFRSRLITVLLFGQAELTFRLSPDEGLFLRVTQYHMKGLTKDEVLQYIDLRCRTAGGDMKEIFEADTLEYIAENLHSPLHINHVCSSSMRAARRIDEKKVKLGMIFECGGIRTPRQILKDNNISIKKFAQMVHMHDKNVSKLLDGETEGVSTEHVHRFGNGITNLSRGTELDTEYHEDQKKQA